MEPDRRQRKKQLVRDALIHAALELFEVKGYDLHDSDDEIVRVLAEREGVDPGTDRRPRLVAAMIGALVFLASKDSPGGDCTDLEATAAFDAYADEITSALSGHWAQR